MPLGEPLDVGRLVEPDRVHRASHVVSNVVIEDEDASTGDVIARSKFHAVEYWNDETRHFAGKYRHHLKRADDGFRIRLRRVDLINAEGPFEYVLQFWL